ncbi:hypothetical protein [Immundisolibacter sp.]
MFGALAGAIEAHKIADRIKEKEQFVAQLRTTNSAIMSAFVVANAAMAVKNQSVKDIYTNYLVQKSSNEEYRRRLEVGELVPGTPFDLEIDLRIVNMQRVPIGILEAQIFEKLSIDGRPLALAAAIAGALANLDETLSKRNELISEFKSLRGAEAEKIPAMYLGTKLPDGNVSTEYQDSVVGAYKYIDDIIFFSKLLCEDLHRHGEKIKNAHEKRFGQSNQKVSRADFSLAKEKNLLPDEAGYSDWLSGFITSE